MTLDDYYQGRDEMFAHELTSEMEGSALDTVEKCTLLLDAFGQQRKVNSGWRPKEINAATPHASPTSLHMVCKACDISDPDRELDDWCLAHPEVLERIGLWQESPASTPGWCHVQTVPPRSGRRVFIPS